jgi:uncharacterized protein (DUF608 family)
MDDTSYFSTLPQGKLFPTGLPERDWIEFPAAGFSELVSGVIYRTGNPPCCGMPLGGISTGCLDIDPHGVFGFSSLFNPMSPAPYEPTWRLPRKLPSAQPVLGLSVKGKTWVLATRDYIEGCELPWCTEPRFLPKEDRIIQKVQCMKLEGVEPVKEIHYWGHYPLVDMEFETDAPVSVGVRAWSPFIPGDVSASNIPAAIFEVHLRNVSNAAQAGAVAMNFPGPDPEEALSADFTRQEIKEDFQGIFVRSTAGVQYILGVIGDENVRCGAGLNKSSTAWSKIAAELPCPEDGEAQTPKIYRDSSSSVAVDFSLQPGETRIVRFLLAWYAPVWEGNKKERLDSLKDGWHHYRWVGSKWGGDTHLFTQMYATRYASALEIARRMAEDYPSLLKRILAWQTVIYREASLPLWLKDSLINILALIPETTYWAQAKPPLGDWAYPGGAFGILESPRGCPDLSCIPSDWYGNHPIVFFFPELARSSLKIFKQFQKEDGEIPFVLGIVGDLPDLATPGYYWQVSLNGMCYVSMVDRLWQRTGDDSVLEEFYASAKKVNTFTMNLNTGPGGVISMPEIGGMEWFEFGEWVGMAAHMGGLRLAQLRMMERMAEHFGDKEYVQQCQQWLADGTRAMEEELWTGNYYLNYHEKQTGKKSEDVMAYQLDGEWAALYAGLPGVFQNDRIKIALETVRRCNIALTPEVGAANFTHPNGSPCGNDKDGAPQLKDKTIGAYGAYAMFSVELLILAMTYMYAGEVDFGLDLARRHWENLVCRQGLTWDQPNIVRGDTGERVYGTDYSMNMMLWALPAAISQHDMNGLTKPGGFVERIMRAGNA